MTKDELVKEFKDKFINSQKPAWEVYAELVIARETAMLEEIAHPLREYKCGAEGYTDEEDVIDKTLAIIQSRKGGK
jgi:hypothetical protein